MLLRLTQALGELGVESSVVNLGAPNGVVGLFKEAGVHVWSLDIAPNIRGAASGIRRLRRILQRVNPHIIQGWMYHANLIALLARTSATGQGAKTLWNIRRGLDDYSKRRVKTRCVIQSNSVLSRLSDGVIYCSSVSRAQHESFGFDSSKGVVLENGFDTERFRPRAESKEIFRFRHGISQNEIVIGNIGRYDLAKGHTYLVQAFSELLKTHPNSRLVLIGRGVDESNFTLVSQLKALGCHQKVLLLGEQAAVEDLYSAFDIYCSASISEGFPNALSEALASGVACVATDTGASKQLVDGLGPVVGCGDSKQLVGALMASIESGREARQSAGMLGRQRIVTQYSLASVARGYLGVYQGVVVDR